MNYLTGISEASDFFDVNQIEAEFDNRRLYVDSKIFKEQLLNENVENSIDKINEDLSEISVVSEKNKIFFTQISELIKANLNGEIDNNSYEQSLVDKYNEFSNTDIEDGNEIIGEILTISLMSCKWWRENPEAANEPGLEVPGNGPSHKAFENNNKSFVVPVVAMDAAGALVSVGAVAINNYLNNGSVNWKAVGTGAVIGAVTGSTGIVGKVGKWISSFF